MTNTEQLREQLLNKLKELFQLNQPDLDFGFYRIMHSRVKEVTAFIENELLDTIKSAFDSAKVEGSQNDFDSARAKVIDNIGDDAFDENGNLKEMYANSKAGKEFLAAQQKLADAGSALTGEDSVYYHLYRFFSRYYDNGDFVSMRYHTRETEGMARPYAIPYGGEEVMLHWANADQYYIKTSENFNNFSFDLTKATVFDKMGREEKILAGIPGMPLMVHFKVVDADEGEHGNIKADPNKKREFFLAAENPVQLDRNGELEIHFEFRQAEDSDKITPEDEALVKEAYGAKNKGDFPLLAITAKIIAACHDLNQKLLNEKSPYSLDYYMAAMQYPCPTDVVKNRILLSKYLYQYTARNTSDYFIHKNLRGFLRREMDFYIKNEIMNLDDIEQSTVSSVENYLILLKVFRKIAGKLIDFLGQLEDFQKKLWLKKKFITQCDYCITLDRVPEEFYQEIASNELQREEWEKLYFISNMQERLGGIYSGGWYKDANGEMELTKKRVAGRQYAYSIPLSIGFLKENPYLMLDTKFFDSDFKMRLLAQTPDLDEQCDGVLIHSENFQALNLLQERYKEQVKCIYIDPPYNTEDDGFIYKDCYKDSSWLSMIFNRSVISDPLLADIGSTFISIGDEEQELLASLIRQIYGKENFFATLIWEKKKKGSFLSGNIAKMKDYILCYAHDLHHFPGLIGEINTETETYPCINPDNPPSVRKFKSGIFSKYRESNVFRPAGTIISAGNMTLKLLNDLVIKGGLLQQDIEIEGNWRYSQENIDSYMSNNSLYITQDLYIRRIVSEPRKKIMKDLLLRIGDNGEADFRKYDISNVNSYGWGTNEDANEELHQLLGVQYAASYPKPSKLLTLLCATTQFNTGIFLDYFAGSGTTGHAIINLNREDKGKRKYILVEMGEYFDTVLKPRIEKVVFSEKWKDGKPQEIPSIKGKHIIEENQKFARDQKDDEVDLLSFNISYKGTKIEDNPEWNEHNPFNGVSHCFKYMRLESYEDTLNNLVMPEEDRNLAKMSGSLKEDYMLHYMLDAEAQESLLNIRDFANPWGYQLKVKQPNSEASVVSSVDLVETFNYLIGLRIQQYYRIQNYSATFKRTFDPELPNGGEQTRLEFATKPELNSDGAWRFQKIEGWIPANPQTPNDGRKKNVLIIWRTLTGNLELDNLMLDWYMSGTLNLDEKTPEYDIIYVNGSNNLGADRKETDTFQVRLIEEEFLKKMWTAGEC